ncbi:hypothetical protein [Methylobacterium pseudosasicola]|uniref:Uncharacterized protein n=1 Tax=Methylobacterium pseudosasicola TaxID=582667 RepID=A0A1I4P6S2_9HYPH|nr:hypothetical protein [Methylobacterium pseudosasicola]SFM23247.1 hypothetical protein SAMN05192568_102370 [Methylobacterium pseudosasicola]
MRGHMVGSFDEYPVHPVSTYAFLAAMRGMGPEILPAEERRQRRPGLRATQIDQSHRDESGVDTVWLPGRR